MALRIACDLDGTVADMETALQREAEKLFGTTVDVRARGHIAAQVEESDGNPDDARRLDPDPPLSGAADGDATIAIPNPRPIQKRGLTRRETRELWAHVRGIENFWLQLQEVEPGAVLQLAQAAATHRWEILFLTQRPSTKGETAQLQSQRWLDAHGFKYPSVYVMNGSRGKVADALALDAVLDDRAENCLDVTTDSNARSFLIWRDAPALVPAAVAGLGITVVYSFLDALKHLQQMTDKATRSSGLVGRLRAAIGI